MEVHEALLSSKLNFEDHLTIFQDIPFSTVNLCIQALKMKIDGYSEAYYGLDLAIAFVNSKDHAAEFVVEINF